MRLFSHFANTIIRFLVLWFVDGISLLLTLAGLFEANEEEKTRRAEDVFMKCLNLVLSRAVGRLIGCHGFHTNSFISHVWQH